MEKNKGSCRGGNSSPLAENSVWVRGNQIGRGSYGSVSIGVNRHDGAVFAVKSVDSSSSCPSHLDSLENEIRILRSLPPSPFVVRYLADDHTFSLENPKRLFRNLHVEYLPGGTAADFGKVVRKESDLRRYAWCLVAALNHLHSNGIVHCDVKGANVLLDSTRTVAKLADFGSAADRNGGGRIAAPRGSPLWMAPEVVRGEKQGRESDVWSLGCTVIEMATGAPAWKDEGVGPTLSRIGYSEESPRLPEGLSELCRDFLDKCLRREPERRWSCERLLDHPFLMRVETPDGIKERRWSPRSVIDWPELDDESDVEEELADFCQESAEQRIGKLAAAGVCYEGSIWESDGWVAVRSSSVVIREEEEELGCCSTSGRRNGDQGTEDEEEEEEGATSGFPNLVVVPAATVGEGGTLFTSLDGFLLLLSLLKMLYHYTNLNYNITKTNAYILLTYLPSFLPSFLRVTSLFPFLLFFFYIEIRFGFLLLRK